MGIYISSKGERKDTKDMPVEYLRRALEKATKEGNQANIDVLIRELDERNATN